MESPHISIRARRGATILSLLLNVAARAQADCAPPPSPGPLPDGATADESVMIATMLQLQAYRDDVDEYLRCLDREAQEGRLSSEAQTYEHNGAIDRLQAVADQFNREVREFKARREPASGSTSPTS